MIKAFESIRFSVIIPCRNEEKYIAKCLDSFVNANIDKNNLQVLVVDGMSDDQTRSIVGEYDQKNHWILLLNNPEKITPHAFNIGIEHSKGFDIAITVSAHSEIDADFFKEIYNAFTINPSIGCVGGVSENIYYNDTAKKIGKAMSSPFGVGNAHFRTGTKDGFVDTVSYPAYKMEVFEKVGLFNTALIRNQDDEFNFRVVKAGYKIYLSRKIKSKYYVRGSFDKLYRQYYQYGYWKVYVNHMHNTVTSLRQLIPPAFVSFLFFGLILSCFSWFLAGFFAGILFVYLLGSFYFAMKIAENAAESFGIMYAFFILHFSYGTGYLKGILDFYLLRKNPTEKAKSLTR